MTQFFTRIHRRVDGFFIKHNIMGMKDIIAFVVLTLAIHFSWRFWEIRLGLFPIQAYMGGLMDWLADKVLYQSVWMLNTLAGYQVTIEGSIIHFPSGYDISIGRSCSGMKQIMQFVLLMVIYKGPWIKKLWFIPMGVLLVHLSNLFRIFFSGVLSMNHPTWMQYAHDNVLRWLFYLVICLLWLWWVKKISKVKGQKSKVEAPAKSQFHLF